MEREKKMLKKHKYQMATIKKPCRDCGWDMTHEEDAWFCTNPNCAHEEDYEEE